MTQDNWQVLLLQLINDNLIKGELKDLNLEEFMKKLENQEFNDDHTL